MAQQLSQKDKAILAYTLLGEAGNQGRAGMEAVAWTLRNRSESGRYPSNPAAVAVQSNRRGVHQYSTWNGNPISTFSSKSSGFNTALSVIDKVFSDNAGTDPTQGAMSYYANSGTNAIKKPYWFDKEAVAGAVQIGDHLFAAKVPKDIITSLTPQIDWHETARGNRGYIDFSNSNIPNVGPSSVAARKDVPNGVDALAYVISPGALNPTPAYAEAHSAALAAGAISAGGAGWISAQPMPRPLSISKPSPAPLTSHSVQTLKVDMNGNPILASKPATEDVFSEMKAVKAYNRLQQSSGSWKTSGTTTVHADGSVSFNAGVGATALPQGVTPSSVTRDLAEVTKAQEANTNSTHMSESDVGKLYEGIYPIQSGFVTAGNPGTQTVKTQVPTYITTYTTETRQVPLHDAPIGEDVKEGHGAAGMNAQAGPTYKTITVQVPHQTKVMKTVTKTIKVAAPVATAPVPPPTVRLASGKSVPVGTQGTAQGGRYSYAVNSSGQVVNMTTGKVSSNAGQSSIPGFDRSTGSWNNEKKSPGLGY